MLQTLRVVMSRVFAVWIILIACMSAPPQTSSFPSQLLRPETRAALSAPTSVRRRPPTKPRPQIKRPTNATLCLAQALFFEARGEPFEGLEAVAATVFNRVEHTQYASSICGVVYQPYQYSWTMNPMNWARRPPTTFIRLATGFIRSKGELQAQYPVTHFHRADIEPRWAPTLEYVMTIGQHKFYRG